MSIRSLPSLNYATEDDEPPDLCTYDSDDEDDLTDHSRSTTPPLQPHVLATKTIVPSSYNISFPPVETLIPMFPSHEDDNTPSP